MGYSYSYSNRLCCDSCGVDRGVRKRKCPYKVDGLSYCPAPALCSPCYKADGGLRGVHADACRDGAAQMQVEADAKAQAILDGEYFVKAAWGSYGDTIPQGMVGLLYEGREGRIYFLAPSERYEWKSEGYKFGSRPVLSELMDVMVEWPGHPESGTKRIA